MINRFEIFRRTNPSDVEKNVSRLIFNDANADRPKLYPINSSDAVADCNHKKGQITVASINFYF